MTDKNLAERRKYVTAFNTTMVKIWREQINLLDVIDTGALYRSIGLFVRRNNADPKNVAEVEPLLSQIELSLVYTDKGQRVILNGEDVSDYIRTPEISMYASAVSALPPVRAFLLKIQRDMVEKGDVVMDGRDIGTTVFPDAELKIFVTASPEIRAQRRYDELKAKGEQASFDDILENVKQRDYIDQHRAVSPLRQADDALLLDNSHLTITQQKEWLMEQFRLRTNS